MTPREYLALNGAKKPKKNKFGAKKTIVFGKEFGSKLEASRYLQLLAMEKAGEITDLKTQVAFQVLAKQNSAAKERAVTYVADFTYREGGKLIVEDTKSKATQTPEYIIKRKLMLHVFGIAVREVFK